MISIKRSSNTKNQRQQKRGDLVENTYKPIDWCNLPKTSLGDTDMRIYDESLYDIDSMVIPIIENSTTKAGEQLNG